MNDIAPDIDSSTIALGLQLAFSAGLALLMIVTHSLGLFAIGRGLRLGDRNLEELSFGPRVIGLVAAMGGLLFLLHIFEIFIFAGFYLAVDAMQTLEEALYYSASAYATLGRTAEYFPTQWRLIGAVEALIGFLLIGWSTAFMVKTMSRLSD